MVEWLETRTGNLETLGSSALSVSGVVPSSNPRPHFVNSQLVNLPTCWDF